MVATFVLALVCDAAPMPTPVPRQEPVWLTYKSRKKPETVLKSKLLIDIESRVPASEGTKWRFDCPITHAHESTHAIHYHLSKPGKQALYVGNGRYAVFDHPQKVRLSTAGEFVPRSLREHRYEVYLDRQTRQRHETINGATILVASRDSEPLYLFDEWVSYNNGASAGLQMAELGIQPNTSHDLLHASLEMAVYATAMVLAIRKYDPGYWNNNPDFQLFVKRELRRSWTLYQEGQKHKCYTWSSKTLKFLAKDPQAAPLRTYWRELGLLP